MNEQDPDLLAGDNLDRLRGRGPYSPMSERFRLTELLETAKYQNDLLAQKCRELEKENFDLAANQCHAGYGGEYGHHRCREIDRLTAERDEARREVCEIMHYTGYLCGDYANHRKWDCYKDDRHHPFSEEIKQNFNAWMDGQYELHAKEMKRLKDERDEARRAVCCGSLPSDYKTWKPADVDAALKLVAAQQGWDCFKEDTDER